MNRGKRSITVDLADREGQRIVRALAAKADIVLENFKAGTLAKYGLGYDDLAAVNPALIYCSITGFGQDGPRREQAAYDFMIQGMSGLMSVTGEADGKPGGGPQKVGVPIVDIMTGMYAAIAVLAALARRAETGQGEYIDIGMLDVGVSFLANQAMNFLISGKPPRRSGNAHPNIQPQDVFRARDGYFALAVGNDDQFARLCDVIGRPDLAADERFRTNAGRVRNNATLTPLLAEILAGEDRDHWVRGCERAGVPCGPINTIPEVFEDPQVKHRGMLIEIAHAVAGAVPQVASPDAFQECAAQARPAAAAAGRAHRGNPARAGVVRRRGAQVNGREALPRIPLFPTDTMTPNSAASTTRSFPVRAANCAGLCARRSIARSSRTSGSSSASCCAIAPRCRRSGANWRSWSPGRPATRSSNGTFTRRWRRRPASPPTSSRTFASAAGRKISMRKGSRSSIMPTSSTAAKRSARRLIVACSRAGTPSGWSNSRR